MKILVRMILGLFGAAWLLNAILFDGGDLSLVASSVYAAALLVCCFIDEVNK